MSMMIVEEMMEKHQKENGKKKNSFLDSPFCVGPHLALIFYFMSISFILYISSSLDKQDVADRSKNFYVLFFIIFFAQQLKKNKFFWK